MRLEEEEVYKKYEENEFIPLSFISKCQKK